MNYFFITTWMNVMIISVSNFRDKVKGKFDCMHGSYQKEKHEIVKFSLQFSNNAFHFTFFNLF